MLTFSISLVRSSAIDLPTNIVCRPEHLLNVSRANPHTQPLAPLNQPHLSWILIWWTFLLQPIKIQSLLASQLIFTLKCLFKCQTPNTAFISFALSQLLLPANTYQYNCFFMYMYASEDRKFTHLLPMLTSDYSPRCFNTTLLQVLVSCNYVCSNNNSRLYIYHGA